MHLRVPGRSWATVTTGKSSKREDLVPGFYLHTSLFYPKVNIPEGNILVTGQCLAAKSLLPAVSFPVLSALLELRESPTFQGPTVQPLLKIAAGAEGYEEAAPFTSLLEK